MLRVHLQVYVNVGKLKSTLMVSLSQYYKPCLTRSLYYKLCYCRAIFEVVTALFDLEYFIKMEEGGWLGGDIYLFMSVKNDFNFMLFYSTTNNCTTCV